MSDAKRGPRGPADPRGTPGKAMGNIQSEYMAGSKMVATTAPSREPLEIGQALEFVEEFMAEVDSALDIGAPNPHLNMAIHLVRNHLEGRISTASSAIAASGTPYATARRKLAEMQEAGLVEQRPRTRTGKSFSLHPSAKLMQDWSQLSDRILRMARQRIGVGPNAAKGAEYYFGGSYQEGRSIQPPQVLPEPLALPGGLRILVHGDPTFMVMESLKRQFEQVVGTKISQRRLFHRPAARGIPAQRRPSRQPL